MLVACLIFIIHIFWDLETTFTYYKVVIFFQLKLSDIIFCQDSVITKARMIYVRKHYTYNIMYSNIMH